MSDEMITHAEWIRQRQRDALIEQQATEIERLRAQINEWYPENERLEAEIERLKAALRTIADSSGWAANVARAALEVKP